MIRADGIRLAAAETTSLRGSVAPLLLLSAACHIGGVLWGLSSTPSNEIAADAGSAVVMTVTLIAGPEAGSPASTPARPGQEAPTDTPPTPTATISESADTEEAQRSQFADHIRSADRPAAAKPVVEEAASVTEETLELPVAIAAAPIPPPRPAIAAIDSAALTARELAHPTEPHQRPRNESSTNPSSNAGSRSNPAARDGMAGTTQGAAPHANNPAPSYPASARRRGHQGRVLLLVEVTLDGQAGKVTLERSSGHKALDRAALETVRRWRFRPAIKNGIPLMATLQVPIRFALK